MGSERRDLRSRATVVQRVIDGIVQNPSVTLTVSTLQQWLGVPLDAAQRILDRLARAKRLHVDFEEDDDDNSIELETPRAAEMLAALKFCEENRK